jgi:hypothetical protein
MTHFRTRVTHNHYKKNIYNQQIYREFNKYYTMGK